MTTPPGHESGQPPGAGGLVWASYIDALVRERGSLAAVAAHLAAQRGYADDVASVERGLRRLRGRGHRDGGVWGRRAIAVFGVPHAVEQRVRWMGHYHSRFTDLPTSLCREILASWDCPPLSETSARSWIQLGFANVALRLREHERAVEHLRQAALATGADASVCIELGLVEAYLLARDDPAESGRLLDDVEASLAANTLEEDTHACLFARLVDQRAYALNKPLRGAPDHRGAVALYERIPEIAPPFARCRRHNGLGWSLLRLGDRERAVLHARASVSVAGDSGSLRLRAMALNLLARALGGDEGREAATRAEQIASRLEDEELIARYAPANLVSQGDPTL